MTQDKVSIDWNDLKTRKVDNRLREQDAMERNREYAQMAEDALPEATPPSSNLFNNAIFCMTLFGLIGGLLAWGAGVLIAGPLTPTIGAMFHYIPGAQADSAARFRSIDDIEQRLATGLQDKPTTKIMIDEVRNEGYANPYFRVAIDPTISDAKRRVMVADLQANDNYAIFLINLLSYGLCGMMIAMSLAMAEPVTQHKVKSAWINAGTGAAVGLLGGVAAAFLSARLAGAAASFTHDQAPWLQKLSSQSLMWGMLGAFLGTGSGVVLRNVKKVFVGSVGGLCGGCIGGVLYNPMDKISQGAQIGQFVAFIAIGVVAGLATGLLENAVKAGWLKVTSGIIAGKQFILYRNPTYIGASPDCQIYLFKDAQVGKRHAAIHLLQNGIEIEDLPLGSETLVNGKPVKRAKLKNGDTIQIGATSFRFQQKRPTAGA